MTREDKLTATAIGGPKDRQKITGTGTMTCVPVSQTHMMPSMYGGFPQSYSGISSEIYRYECFYYGATNRRWDFWIHSSLTNDDAFAKIIDGYSAVIPNPVSQDYSKALKDFREYTSRTVQGIPYGKEYKDELKKSGIFDDRPNPLLDLQGKSGTIKTYTSGDPVPDFAEEQKQKEDYDPWDSKNWGL